METGIISDTPRVNIGMEPHYSAGSQKYRILELLKSRPFVPLPEVMNLRIAAHCTVITGLRHDGYIIENVQEGSHSIYIFRWYDERKKRRNLSFMAQLWHNMTSHF